MNGLHAEIERKYLITMPEEELLASQPGAVRWGITQVYLTAAEGETRRIRRIAEDGSVRFYRTVKHRVSDLTSQEDESEISGETYDALLREADPARSPISKTRWRIPWREHVLEIDLYPFWTDRAVLETELTSEQDTVSLPDWIRVLKEVTGDGRYRNVSIAQSVPNDPV